MHIVKYFFIYILIFTHCASDKKPIILILDTFENGVPKQLKEILSADSNTYILKEFYPDSTLSFEAMVEDGYFKDYKKSYFKNGNPEEFTILLGKARLTHCCPDGKYTSYYKNGHKLQEHTKINELYEGEITSYDSQGRKTSIYNVKRSLKDGIDKNYRKNGTLYSIANYRNDTLIDKVIYFDPKGDTLKIYSTYKGKQDFPVKKWLYNGQLFYASYTKPNKYDEVEYLWKDSAGNVIKRLIIHKDVKSEYSTGSTWISPN